MIFHPNPMVEIRSGYWQDTQLSRVVVHAVSINTSKNPVRWVVFKRTMRGSLVTLTRHITQGQAVVSAQTLANRLWKIAQRKDKPKYKRRQNNHLTIIKEERTRMSAALDQAIERALTGDKAGARAHADEIIQFLERNF